MTTKVLDTHSVKNNISMNMQIGYFSLIIHSNKIYAFKLDYSLILSFLFVEMINQHTSSKSISVIVLTEERNFDTQKQNYCSSWKSALILLIND
jgi:hypothetical protein